MAHGPTDPWQVVALCIGEWTVVSAIAAAVFSKFAHVKFLDISLATPTIGSHLAIAGGYFIVANEGLRNFSIVC